MDKDENKVAISVDKITARKPPALKPVTRVLDLGQDSACSTDDMVDVCDNTGFLGPSNRRDIYMQSVLDPSSSRQFICDGALSTQGPLRQDTSPDLETTCHFMSESKAQQYKLVASLFPGITLPPPLRHVWSDMDNSDTSTFGKVIGYLPEMLYNFRWVQNALIGCLRQTRKELIRTGEVDPDSLETYFGEDPHILLRVSVLNLLEACYVDPSNPDRLLLTKWSVGLPINHNTFDTQEAHGRNSRLRVNEPVLTKHMLDALSDEEFASLRKILGMETDDRGKLLRTINPTYVARLRAIMDQFELISDAIETRYVNNMLGRRSLPKRIDNSDLKNVFTQG